MRLPEDLDAFPAAARPFAPRVDLALDADDRMHVGSDEHYLCCGASALNVILAALQVAEAPPPRAVLDFGAGAGRVTRWLRAAFPDSAISCCDLRDTDLAFCRARFAAATWPSHTRIAALEAPGRYDLVWLGSVLTHLSERDARALLDKVASWTEPGGLLVASTIGRAGKARQERDRTFIHPEGWVAIEADYAERGFGYADYPDQKDYGLSLVTPSWLARAVEATAGLRLVLLAEKAWDGLHDVVAAQNDADVAAHVPGADARDRDMMALRARIAAMEASTSWRVTAPIRRLVDRLRGGRGRARR